MAAVTICSDLGAQKKVCHCFHCLPFYFPWSDGTRSIIINSFKKKKPHPLALMFSQWSRIKWLPGVICPWEFSQVLVITSTGSSSLLHCIYTHMLPENICLKDFKSIDWTFFSQFLWELMLGKDMVRSSIAVPLVMMDKTVQKGLSRPPLIHRHFPSSRHFSGALGSHLQLQSSQ